MDALNAVYEEKEKRGFIKLNLVSLGFALAGIGVLLLALATVVALPVALNFLGLHNATDLLLRVARWPLLTIVIILGLAVLYRYGPSRREPRWQWISVGSVVAAVAWLISSALLSWYLANFAHYDATYGSLGAEGALPKVGESTGQANVSVSEVLIPLLRLEPQCRARLPDQSDDPALG